MIITAILIIEIIFQFARRSDCCPEEIKLVVNDCLRHYRTKLENLRVDNEGMFFTGTDPETIREICSDLSSSLTCISPFHRRCSHKHQRFLESLLSSHVTVQQMCSRQHFYEEYSMYRKCYYDNSKQTRRCYMEYEDSTRGLSHHHDNDEYCRHTEKLLECVTSTIELNCNRAASALVELLVKASVYNKPHCSSDHSVTTSYARDRGIYQAQDQSSGSVLHTEFILQQLITFVLLLFVNVIY